MQLQLAKSYLLEGNVEQARTHFKLSQGPSLDTLAAQLFIRAADVNITKVLRHSSFDRDYLPEEQGLANCSRAIAALSMTISRRPSFPWKGCTTLIVYKPILAPF